MHFRYSISMHRYYFQTLACVSSRYWLCHCTTINSRAFHRNTGHKCHRWSIPKLMNIQVGRVSLVNNSLSPSIWSSPSSQACEVSFFHEWHGDTIQNIVGFAQRIKCTHISNLTIFLTARKVGNFTSQVGFSRLLNFWKLATLKLPIKSCQLSEVANFLKRRGKSWPLFRKSWRLSKVGDFQKLATFET